VSPSTARITHVWPSASGLLYALGHGADPVVDLDLDGRRVWSFRPSPEPVPATESLPDDVDPGALRFQEWPAALRARLRGRFRVRLRPAGTDGGPEVTVSLDGTGRELCLVDRYGRPLVVNKWGRLGHAIADAHPGMVDRMLDHMDAMRELLERQLGPVVYVTGGTLLGPVRENGHVLPHDDDADLAYLSRHAHPADVALESFQIGRMLRSAGYEVLRLSVGHLQVQFAHQGVPDHYVDVFAGFLLDGWWHQHFAVRERAARTDLLPPSTVLVEGRPEPAPRVPEVMLEALYGPGWAVPDPSFSFEMPASTAERFYGWFGDYNVEREDWEDTVLLALPGDPRPSEGLSAFGRWAHERTPGGRSLLDLGCGTGDDALALAALGRRVRGVDYSRAAVDVASSRNGGEGASFEVLNLLDTRQVVRLGAELASSPESWTVLGRRLLNALEDRGRSNVFRLCSMLLRDGGAAHFDVVADGSYRGIPPHRHLTPQQVANEAAAHSLLLEEAEPRLEQLTWFAAPEEQLVEIHRLTFRRRHR
jgi:SAM-dependent methyltransferase